MLDATIGSFLKTVTEREFDPVIIALLAARGFYDIHFIHGAFEFGKDIVAKRADPKTGKVHQYAIQSKAGDIGLPEWRAVRPQLEESEYNALGHPSFDATLPRVAVLLTTGRLKGAAPTDTQQFAKTAKKRGLARIDFWDREDLIGWLSSHPEAAILSTADQHELQRILVDVRADAVDEPALERFSRRWFDNDAAGIEGAVIINALREHGRLDLAAMCAVHMFRAALLGGRTQSAEAARRLLCSVSVLLLDAVGPLLENPADLARVDPHPASLVSYAVTAVRTTEILALAALVHDVDEDVARLMNAVVTLASSHPGAARPVSDQFAVALIPIVTVLRRHAPGQLLTISGLSRAGRWNATTLPMRGLDWDPWTRRLEKSWSDCLAGGLSPPPCRVHRRRMYSRFSWTCASARTRRTSSRPCAATRKRSG